MVAMRDGVRLATDVYLPRHTDGAPAVLVRLPYDKCGRYTFMPLIAPFFTERGYAFVAQDVRGKFRSEGETVAFDNEIDDGYDTIEWLSSQPWCDGSVGMWGDSYYGYTQWAAVASEHPALKAIVPRVTSADLGRVADPDAVTALYLGEYLANYWFDNWIYHWEIDYGHRPLAEVFDPGFEAVGARAKSFDRLVERGGRGESLMEFPGNHPFDALKIPVLHTGGWFDNIMPDQMRDYERSCASRRRRRAPVPGDELDRPRELPVRDRPGDRGREPCGRRRRAGADARALPGTGARVLRRLPGGTHRPGSVPRVRWHLADSQEGPTWPPPGATEMRLYPGRAGDLTPEAGGRRRGRVGP